MLHEFAVEPKLLGTWESFHYLHEKFGVPKARLIAEFPKKWRRMVYDAAENFTEIQTKKLEQWLSEKDFFLASCNRPYRYPENWLKSAEAAHQEQPFHAILAQENPHKNPAIIPKEPPFSEEHHLFNCPPEILIPKTREGFVSACKGLLQYANELTFIDPYFFKGRNTKKRRSAWGKPLLALLQCASCVKNFRYITGYSIRDETVDDRCRIIESEVHLYIPKGKKAEIILLNNIHNRYILSDIGGLKFPYGFDVIHGREDIVNILSGEVHRHLYSKFYSIPDNEIVKSFFISGDA